MDVEKIRALRLAHPFKPFVVITTEGERLTVDQPYFLGMAPDGRYLGVSTWDGIKLLTPERVKDVELLPDRATR